MPYASENWATLTAHNPPNPRKWSMDNVRSLVLEKLEKQPCFMQLQVAREICAGKDVITCTRTGAGKTLSFWVPLLMDMAEGGEEMIFVVSPLTLLGRQNTESSDLLQNVGLTFVALSAENATQRTFKDIIAGKYRVVTVSPDIMMAHPEVQKLWRNQSFTKRLQYFVFDEGHCISQWAKFREQYAKLGDLRYLIPEHIPFYIASATLPETILRDYIRSSNKAPIICKVLDQILGNLPHLEVQGEQRLEMTGDLRQDDKGWAKTCATQLLPLCRRAAAVTYCDLLS